MAERQFQNRGVGEEYTDITVDLSGLPAAIEARQNKEAKKADKKGLMDRVEEVVDNTLTKVENAVDKFLSAGGF